MDIFDKLAFWGRRYEPVTVPGTGSRRFSMGDVLQMFSRSAIFDLTPYGSNGAGATVRPDLVRRIKVSLLDDGFTAIHSDNADWYEVYRTAPSGDLSKVRVVAHSPAGEKVGELRLTVGRRTYEHYFQDDPIFEVIGKRAEG
jgi:hypothetical protein